MLQLQERRQFWSKLSFPDFAADSFGAYPLQLPFCCQESECENIYFFSKMGSDSDCEAPKEETEEEVWVFLEIPFLPQ